MRKVKLYKFSYFFGTALVLTGWTFKIMNWPGASILLAVGLLISLVYVAIALIDIYKMNNKSLIDKLLWLLGFVLLLWVTGYIYYTNELKPKYKIK